METVYLTAHDFRLIAGDNCLADHLNFSIEPNARIGLVGQNGSGKSTLLKEMAQSTEFLRRKGLKVVLLSQHPVFEQATVNQAMDQASQAPDYEKASALTKLGLNYDDTPISSLSGGWQRRLALAIALVQEADLLLLDEPTNHLDIDMIEWLETTLARKKAAFVLVTHDRYFLERVCDEIWELDQQQLYRYEGNYDAYLEKRQARLERQDKAIHKLDRLYQKELAWVRAGVQARSTKSKSRLDRFEQLRSQRQHQKQASMNLVQTEQRLGKQVFDLEDLCFQYDQRPVIEHLSFCLGPGQRLGIVGPNGCGKSTLLRLFAGQLTPSSGQLLCGQTVKTGYFQQTDQGVDLSKSALVYCSEVASQIQVGSQSLSASALLEQFLLTSDQIRLPMSSLSGGQRRRVYLCRLLLSRANVLLLDEPTNDLDLATLTVLEDFLDDFAGSVVVVSHDRYFLDRVCEQALVWSKDHFELSNDWTYQTKVEPKTKNNRQPARLFTSTQRNRLTWLDQELAKIEHDLKDVNEAMNQADYQQMTDLDKRRTELEIQQETLSLEWLELMEAKEKAHA